MPAPVAALIVRPDGTAKVRDVEPDVSTLQALVGGTLERVRPGDSDFGAWHAFVDEDGGPKRAPENLAATHFARSIGWAWPRQAHALRGPVVFLGTTADGGEADVPPEVVGAAVALWGLE